MPRKLPFNPRELQRECLHDDMGKYWLCVSAITYALSCCGCSFQPLSVISLVGVVVFVELTGCYRGVHTYKAVLLFSFSLDFQSLFSALLQAHCRVTVIPSDPRRGS